MSNNVKKNLQKKRSLKDRFLEAVIKGELGKVDSRGTIVTLKEFKVYFSDIKTHYVSSFLPAATIELGRNSFSHTKFVFRISKGVYLLHPGVLAAYRN